MHNINNNAVQDRLSELFNAKIYRMKYFRHEIFVIYGMYVLSSAYKDYKPRYINMHEKAQFM